MLDLDTPQYSAAQVAAAAGIDGATFRSYFLRGHFRMVGKTDVPADRKGTPHRLALRDALGFAVAAELIRSGVAPKEAWKVGLWDFAHTGDTDRNPGELFDFDGRGFSLLIYWPQIKEAKIVPILPDGKGLGFADLFCPIGYARTDGVVVVMLNFIYKRVVTMLVPEKTVSRSAI